MCEKLLGLYQYLYVKVVTLRTPQQCIVVLAAISVDDPQLFIWSIIS